MFSARSAMQPKNFARKLGESLASIQKFNTPIQEATTSSLEALKAYGLGNQARATQGEEPALPFFKQAVSLDPNFAIAYATLGQVEANLGERAAAVEYTKKAYALRDRASEAEKFYIDSHYYGNVTGDEEQAIQVYQLWTQTYPRDSIPFNNLGVSYALMGQWEKALPVARQAHQLAPDESISAVALSTTYLGLGRFDESKATIDQALAAKLDVPNLHRVALFLGVCAERFVRHGTRTFDSRFQRPGKCRDLIRVGGGNRSVCRTHRKSAWTDGSRAQLL